MTTQWYYVQGSERVGPVSEEEIHQLFGEGTLTRESYVWRKGFDNWRSLDSIEEFGNLGSAPPEMEEDLAQEEALNPPAEDLDYPDLSGASDDISAIPQMGESDDRVPAFDIHAIGFEEKVFSIKVGYDRGANESEYGPFSLSQLHRAYSEQRINEKTFIFTPGMTTWVLLGDFERSDEIMGGMPPQITDADRRINVRKPFVARLFFHDNESFYEGICRDISVGGLQILVSNYPCGVGDNVSMNVHPDNSEYHFTASGTVVRVLDGNTGFSLRFEDLSEEAVNAIQGYISEN
jgi:hypothetical protein